MLIVGRVKVNLTTLFRPTSTLEKIARLEVDELCVYLHNLPSNVWDSSKTVIQPVFKVCNLLRR